MFEISRKDHDIMDYYVSEGYAYPGAEYDFTFEDRFVIYHAPLCHRISYIAIDKQTNLSSEVCREKNACYNEFNYKDLIPQILYSIKYTGDRRFLNSLVKNPLEVIDSIFRVVLPEYGYAVREEQINLCKQMFIGLTQKQAAICEAEVGTGKSLAYLVAGLCAKRYRQGVYHYNNPVTITTSSIELQKALVEREIPLLSKALLDYHIIDKPLTAALRKGKEHYFCRFRFEDYLESIKKYPLKYAKTIDYFEESEFAEKAFDLDRYKMSGYMKGKICIKGKCEKRCPYADECKYDAFIQSAMSDRIDLDFQVTNHNLYIMSRKQEGILRGSEFVIIDEAHKFKEAAQDMFGESIPADRIPKYLNWIKTMCNEEEDHILFESLMARVSENNQKLFSTLMKQVNIEDMEDNSHGTIAALSNRTVTVINALAEDILVLEGMLRRNRGKKEIDGKRLANSLLGFTEPSRISVWLESDENGALSLCCCPKNISQKIEKFIWDRSCSHVLTSGTMSDGENFDFFKKEIGLDRISSCLLTESSTPSPFDYANHTRMYIPKGIPTPDNDSDTYINAIADNIVDIVEATNGHTAILFTAYKVLQKVYELTADRLKKYDVICMTRSNKTAISDFKKSKNGVLFASGSMWEGVDCRGDCLSSVIIVRLPFPLRSAALEEKKNISSSVTEFVQEYALPEMLIKLRQGVGRLIRNESDTGLISILDPRIHTNAYGDKIRLALSKYPEVESLEEVKSFFASVKKSEYFNN